MIYCVAFADIERALLGIGFVRTAQTDLTFVYKRNDDVFTIRQPNAHGHLPEVIINDALDNAGLPVPKWDVFWCD